MSDDTARIRPPYQRVGDPATRRRAGRDTGGFVPYAPADEASRERRRVRALQRRPDAVGPVRRRRRRVRHARARRRCPLVMLQLRSGWSHEGGTWSCPGGALEYGEEPLAGALREASEEVGVPTEAARLLGQYVFDPAPGVAVHDGRRRGRRAVRAVDELRERRRRVGAHRSRRGARPARRLRRRLAPRPPDRRAGGSRSGVTSEGRPGEVEGLTIGELSARTGVAPVRAALLRGGGADHTPTAPAAASAATRATRCGGCRSCASPSRSG